MIDCREQIAEQLATVCSNVKLSKPDGDVELPLICYSLQSEEQAGFACERLRWRIAVYTNTFEELITLAQAVDEVMQYSLGYSLLAQTPDGNARQGTDLYMKRLDYSAMVDLLNGMVIVGSK